MSVETVDSVAAVIDEFAAGLPFPLDPFQRDAMRALAAGRSVLVAAPTGTGKTVIAEFGVHLARRAGARAIYTTPIKALSNQKYRDFRAIYGEGEVGLMTGDVVLEPEAAVLVMTTEVLRNMLVQGQRLEETGVIVFDEVHYLGDPERGTAWEEAILLAPPHIPLVCLSATVPNAGEIAEWVRAAHGELDCIIHEERAVPLEHYYFLDGRAHLVIDAAGRRRKSFRGVGGELAGRILWAGAVPRRAPGPEREPRKVPEPWEVVRYLEGEDLTPAIYFLFGRRACEEAADSCLALKAVPQGAELVREAQARLAELPPEDRQIRQVSMLFRHLSRGVAVHHAGLLPLLKMLVEELFAAGRLRAVFATDTLALGINMPARTVVLGEMTKWDGEQRRLLTPNEYRQMTGRAGRRGIDRRGSAVILYSPWVPFEQAIEVATGELLPLESAFSPSYSTALNLWHRPGDEEVLADLYARSLRRFQHDADLKELTERWEALQDRFHELERRSITDPETWAVARELARTEQELGLARKQATGEARRVAEGIARVLERFGYLSVRRPTWKAAYLRAIFDHNALTLGELLANRRLEALEPEEIAEVASWFAWDRESPVRSLLITRRLERLHDEVLDLQAQVIAAERRVGLEIGQPINEDFRGVALAWAREESLAEIARRSRIAEGDLVGAFQKTLDLLGQLRSAVEQARRPEADVLLAKLQAADARLRRGVVEASYRWAVSGPPVEIMADPSEWPVAALPPEEEVAPRRRVPRPRKRPPVFRATGGPGPRPPRPTRPPSRPPRPRPGGRRRR